VNDVEVLATGPQFIKSGIRGIEPVIEELIVGASDEIQLTAYVFTAKARHILELIEEAAEKGIKITMIVNNLEDQHKVIKNKLKELQEKYRHVKVRDFVRSHDNQQLHAKVVVVDRARAVVGSANFSWSGMYGNYEIGLLVRGKHAWELGKVIDALSK
jgi:cardiolipin synthase